MCGRYSVLTEDEIIEIRSIIKEWSMRIVRDDFEDYASSPGEVFPTNHAPVIRSAGDNEISFENIRWGFKMDNVKRPIINARSETLKEKRMFSPLLNVGRCVVPAGEYYEWEKLGKETRKHFITDMDGNLLFMAGLYRESKDGREFVIITKDAFSEVTRIHDRMPVILRAEQVESWLNGRLSPDEIVSMDFNVTVTPSDESNGSTAQSEGEQLSLDV